MRLSRRARLLTLCIACLAMLFGALTPVVLRALSATDGNWAEICTARGARWIRTGDAAPNSTPQESGHTLGHCPLCGLYTPTLGLPPPHESSLPAVIGAYAVPALFLAAPRTLFAWLSAQPRGPPVRG